MMSESSIDLFTLSAHLDQFLCIHEVPDYPGAHNGLQLANEGRVTKVATAVDACFPAIEEAVRQRADLLLVHHGLFWSGVQSIRGAYYKKLKWAMDHGLAIYSSHIPLDVHPELGNNTLLGHAIGLPPMVAFLPWKGILLSLRTETQLRREELVERVSKAVGGPVHLCPGGRETTQHIAIITGGGGSEVAAVAEQGIDTFITGEGPHHTYPLAEELGVNLIYAGHYATETFGVRALGAHLEACFGLPHVFIDHPSGL